MKVPKSVADLIEAFEALPGIGPKTAARLTYYLLHAPDNLSQKLSEALSELKLKTKICSICQNITETDPCEICDDPQRDQSIICVVEDPLDVVRQAVKEIILATNPSMEGEATAMYIQRLVKPLDIKITRIARGIPIGAELEYADEITVRRAVEGRKEY
ncbi:MAG: Recombination protein RecR [Candidatus Curtissbacteria bacterium GW2011_GWA1_40_47]|nr:MAG: Recombination protein RecR [Candidatus Curtissbacteria bacterium GW2011_GWA1_40_47]